MSGEKRAQLASGKTGAVICRNCALWDADAAKDRAGRILRNRVARCMWTASAYPKSIWGSSKPITGYMAPDDGVDCPCFVKAKP